MIDARQLCWYCGYAYLPHAHYCAWCGRALTAPPLGEVAPQHPALGVLSAGMSLGLGGRYRIDRRLGAGGVGETYLAEDTLLQRLCVVKRLRIDPSWEPRLIRDLYQQFAHEAQLLVELNRLGHPCIPEIFEFLPDLCCLVMKHITGWDLFKDLKSRSGPLPEAEALRITRDVCSALVYMHGLKPEPVLHLDLKPRNIMIDQLGRVWVIDFGLAKAVRPTQRDQRDSQAGGSLGYTPPEQWAGAATPRSDIYALAATLYELLTQTRPPESPHMEVPPLRRVNPSVRPEVVRLVEHGMALDPEARPTASEFLAEIDRLLTLAHVPTPPAPTPLPQTHGFVSRMDEIATITQLLLTHQVVAIAGMPGVGKTALAAHLCATCAGSAPIFWHRFRAAESADLLLWSLAGWLAHRGRAGVWQQLYHAQIPGGQPLAGDIVLEYLVEPLGELDALLCLDDLHLVLDDPLVIHILQRLVGLAHAGKIRLILTARTGLDTIAGVAPFPLRGLDADGVRRLLGDQELQIDGKVAATLYRITEGNPQFVLLAREALRQTANPAALLRRLTETDAIEHYLLREVDAGLSSMERQALEAIAVLMGDGGTRACLESLLDGVALRRPLTGLHRRHLVSVEQRDEGPYYHVHAILQSFYYEGLSRQKREDLHRKAGMFYEHEAQIPLVATRHLLRAAEPRRAAALLVRQPWDLLRQGHAHELYRLASAIPQEQLDPDLIAGLCASAGEAATLIGDYDAARTLLEQAVASTASLLPTAAVRGARWHRLLAHTYQHLGAYELAEASCRSGIASAAAPGGARTEMARLYAQLAEVLMRRGSYDEAEAACHTGLAALPPAPAVPGERGALLQRLATIAGQRGNYGAALATLQESLDLARQAGDPILVAAVLHNMGLYHYNLGRLQRATVCYEESLRLKEQIGDLAGRARTVGNLGMLAMAMGDQATALCCFEETRALAERLGLSEQLVLALSNLGHLAYEQGRLDVAREQLAASEQLYARLGDMGGRAYCHYLLGDIALAADDPTAALDHGQRALALSRDLGRRAIEACALRVIGEALLAQGQLNPAAQALADAWAIQVQIGDPYDEAQLRAALARLAHACGDLSRSRAEAETALALARKQHLHRLAAALMALLATLDLGL